MTHPEELLAAYTDDTLAPSRRAEVAAHLATCERCRTEIELAARARGALAAIPDAEPPADVAVPILEELRAVPAIEGPGGTENLETPGQIDLTDPDAVAPTDLRPRRTTSGGRRLTQIVAVAAVFALLAGGFLIVRTAVGGNGVTEAASPAAGAGVRAPQGADAARELNLQVQDFDYTPTSLHELALSVTGGGSPPAQAAAIGSAPDLATAVDCIGKGADTQQGDELTQVIQASYQGTPAYLGVFRRAGDAPRMVIWVVAQQGCRILSYASERA